MPLNHRVKAVLWWCYLHTENPATPAQILTNTHTDQEITQLFATAQHRAQNKNNYKAGAQPSTGPTSTTPTHGKKPTKQKPTRFVL